jgi:hypothetical protein
MDCLYTPGKDQVHFGKVLGVIMKRISNTLARFRKMAI